MAGRMRRGNSIIRGSGHSFAVRCVGPRDAPSLLIVWWAGVGRFAQDLTSVARPRPAPTEHMSCDTPHHRTRPSNTPAASDNGVHSLQNNKTNRNSVLKRSSIVKGKVCVCVCPAYRAQMLCPELTHLSKALVHSQSIPSLPPSPSLCADRDKCGSPCALFLQVGERGCHESEVVGVCCWVCAVPFV